MVTALVAACSESVVEATSASAAGTTGSGGASTASSAGASGSTAASTAGATGSGGAIPGACGEIACTANQLCVRPACIDVQGEECIFQEPDAGQICPPGTARGEQFDLDCVQPGYACVSGCPAAAPFCVDLPASCGGVASCGCLAMDPCAPSNSGACHDADIAGGVLSCSLNP